jgi:hypothetical protein
MNFICRLLLILIAFFVTYTSATAQMITGVWQGQIGTGIKSVKMELKLVAKGDSLTGTSYYYSSNGNYTRYSVKGYFDAQSNSVIWWDDELIEQKQEGLRLRNSTSLPMLAEADFNCPGSGKMMLDGKAFQKTNQGEKSEMHLTKTERVINRDEWDQLITNFTVGGNHPDNITYTENLWKTNKPGNTTPVNENSRATESEKPTLTRNETTLNKPVKSEQPPANPVTDTDRTTIKSTPVPEIQKRFEERKKVLSLDIPLRGDSIEVSFYDNAEIDGDSISLFLNNKILFEHIRLTEKPYTIKFSVNDLNDENELVMVAENLGAIPPNTSYMIAYINGERISANLESTENSSAMIRLKKTR